MPAYPSITSQDINRRTHRVTLLNLVTPWGSLFEIPFEVVDCASQRQFTEIMAPRVRVDSLAELTLDGLRGGLSYPMLAV